MAVVMMVRACGDDGDVDDSGQGCGNGSHGDDNGGADGGHGGGYDDGGGSDGGSDDGDSNCGGDGGRSGVYTEGMVEVIIMMVMRGGEWCRDAGTWGCLIYCRVLSGTPGLFLQML